MVMTEKELEKQIQLQKTVADAYNEIADTLKSEAAKEMDGLNKDVAIAQANALQTLLAVTSIRIGLNIGSVRKQANSEEVEQPKEESNEQKGTAEEKSESEQ